jgi:threonine synthase
MDIQVASNFERLLFDLVKEDDKKVSNYMEQLSTEGRFKLNIEELKILQENFIADSISGKDALLSITLHHEKLKYIYDPHTATAVSAKDGKGIRLENLVVLATAHPYKFLETVEPNLFHKESIPVPKQFSNIMDKKEKFDIIGNTITEVKNYILGKIQ